ncbi:MAG: UDP-N-acetylmuramate--L-alanine ligase [Bacteroidales bacterium]|nr:UDP-N-acetylmuramate--L-alanine ligase [Bacteroidales bacterium]MCF8454335.1 UDP-N-acetylmuramate--L-alanine ligase [Bacteroidales bacterium]
MYIDRINKVYCIGIGGIGVSALARYFMVLGKIVSGYDLTPSTLTQSLQLEGIDVHFTDDPARLPFSEEEKETTLVIYTPAVPANHKELGYLKEAGFTVMKRSQVLGLIANQKEAIAVAGTHGKTSVSGMLSYILESSGMGCSAFLGGISRNFNSNLVYHLESQLMVVEADEFDRSFLQLFPSHAIITSTDADHLDIYGKHDALIESFTQFASQVQPGGFLLLKKGLGLKGPLPEEIKTFTYSITDEADFYADNIRIEEGSFHFNLHLNKNETIEDISLKIPGRVNMENATAAAAMAWLLGVGKEKIKLALASFEGMLRRYDFQIRKDNLIFIDDYAHHPREIEATVLSLKELYPGRKLTGIFQPHLFSRTRDFAEGFAQSLSLLDCIILLDIYPARELPIKGVSSKIIFDQINKKEKYECTKAELPEFIAKLKPEFLVTMGAGDIDRLVPVLKKILLESE